MIGEKRFLEPCLHYKSRKAADKQKIREPEDSKKKY